MMIGLSKKKALFGDILLMFSMILFFALGFYMLPVEDIGTQVTTFTINATSGLGITNSTETHTFIEDQETFYLIYLYWGMAMLSLILFMLGHIKIPEHWGDN